MNAITLAIEVFESKIIEIRLASQVMPKGSLAELLDHYEARDSELARCLWAIELLHAAHIDNKKAATAEVKTKDSVFANIF